jgi:hypothetical protein
LKPSKIFPIDCVKLLKMPVRQAQLKTLKVVLAVDDAIVASFNDSLRLATDEIVRGATPTDN